MKNLEENYNKWVYITGIDSLDSYFENALLEVYKNCGYKKYTIKDEIYIEDSRNYKWLFFYFYCH